MNKGKNEKKEAEKKGSANMKRCKNLCEEKGKKVHTCNSINTSVGVQIRVRIWRLIDSGRDTIEESTRVC